MLLFRFLGKNAFKQLLIHQRTSSIGRPTSVISYLRLSEVNNVHKFSTSAVHLFAVAQQHDEVLSADCDPFSDLKQRLSKKPISLEAIKQATVSGLSEHDAIYLMSLCGKIKSQNSLKCKQASMIFKASSTKSVALFNQLLQTYIDNEKMFTSKSILNHMNDLKLKPNKNTYAKLIAKHCLDGEMDCATILVKDAKKENLPLPKETSGHLVYGFCIAGSPNSAQKIIDEQMTTGSGLSWDTLLQLLIGLAQTDSFDLFLNLLGKYGPQVAFPCKINHVLELFHKLTLLRNHEQILPLLQYLKVSPKDILYANNFLKKLSLKESAFLLNALLKNCNGTLKLTAKNLEPARVVLKHCVRSDMPLDQLLVILKNLKTFYSKNNTIEYLALSIIARERPLLVKNFVKSLSDFGIILKSPSPLSSYAVSNPNLLAASTNLSALYAMGVKSKFPVEKLKQGLSSKNSTLSADIFKLHRSETSDNTHEYDADLVSKTLMLVMQDFALNNWSFTAFQTLLQRLHADGFRMNSKSIQKLQLVLGPESDFLFDFSFHDNDKITFKNSRQTWTHLIPNSINFFSTMSRLNLQNDVNLHSTAHALTDYLIDLRYSNSDFVMMLEKYKNLPLFHLQLLPPVNDLIFITYLEKGMIKKAKDLLTKKLINLDIQMLPSSILKAKSTSAMKLLMQHMLEHQDYHSTVWMVFSSLVKADMIEEARKIVVTDATLSMDKYVRRKIIKIFHHEPDFVQKINTVLLLCQDLPNFSKAAFYVDAVRFLLLNNRFKEARNLTDCDIWSKINWTVKTDVNFLFYKSNQMPSRNILPKYQRLFYDALMQENFEADNVLWHLKNMQSNYENMWNASLRTLLTKLYEKIPLDEYETWTERVQTILPKFNPNLVSGIITDRIQRLAQASNVEKAVQFAVENLQESTEKNFETWSTICQICGDAALKEDDFLSFKQLYNVCLGAVPKVHALATSYMLYSHLKSGNLLTNLPNLLPENVPLGIHTLVGLVARHDAELLPRLYDGVKTLSNSHSKIMNQFLSSVVSYKFDSETVQKIFESQQLSAKALLEIADQCYKTSESLDDLQRIDSFFRTFDKKVFPLHADLNTELFSKFCSTFKETGVNDKMLNYLVKMYHQIPSSGNNLYVRTIYLDLLTKAKCIPVEDNTLCVYL